MRFSSLTFEYGLDTREYRWTLEYILPLAERDLDKFPSPALITLWLGANDAALTDGMNAEQHVSVDEYSANLRTTIERLRTKAPAANFVLITPPPVDDDHRRLLNNGSLDRSNEQAGVYASACIQTAQDANVTVLDLYSSFNTMETDERNACLLDGLHLSAKGNQLMQQQLVATIKDAFPDLATALAASQLPGWRDLGSEVESGR